MLPSLAVENIPYRRSSNAILFRECGALFAVCATLANLAYLTMGKPRALSPAELPTSVNALSKESLLSTFCYLVLHIVAWCSKKQMRWIDASRSVAGMADEHAIRNISIVNLPRDAVGQMVLAVKVDFAVALRKLSSPSAVAPTIIWAALLHVIPEPRFQRRQSSSFERVPKNISLRFTLNPSKLAISLLRNWRESTASTSAVSVWNILQGVVRATMRVHEKLTFLLPRPRAFPRRWDNFIGCQHALILSQFRERHNHTRVGGVGQKTDGVYLGR